jgi:NADPH:quinone reductase-like Zn-dependent oxidoreductase
MKAIVQERFGPPDVLRLDDVDRPEIGPNDVLVRVHAAALNPYDWHMLRGDPYIARLMGGVGLTRPKSRIAGIDAAGVVEAVGSSVRDLRPGDEVYGLCPGAFAEYARGPASKLAPKPAGLSFEQAAAIPMAGSTALRAIRDVGAVRSGQRVLINGAGGGVGHFAVQIAAGLGAEVTGVSSSGNLGLVRSLGADHVVDYTSDDFTETTDRYDLVLDNVGNQPLGRVRRVLTPTGTLALNAGGSPGHVFGAVGGFVKAAALNSFVKQRLRPVPTRESRDDLLALTALVEGGKLAPVVDRTYPLAEVADGLRHVERGHARGKAVVTVL